MPRRARALDATGSTPANDAPGLRSPNLIRRDLRPTRTPSARAPRHHRGRAEHDPTLTNEDDSSFAIEAALHTYLHVGSWTLEGLDVRRVRERYATQTGDVTFIGPTDAPTPPPSRSRSSTPKSGRRIIDKNVRLTIVEPPGHRARQHERRRRGRVAELCVWKPRRCASVKDAVAGPPHIVTQTLAGDAGLTVFHG